MQQRQCAFSHLEPNVIGGQDVDQLDRRGILQSMEVLPRFFQVPHYPARYKVNASRTYRKLIRLSNGCMITSFSSDGFQAED